MKGRFVWADIPVTDLDRAIRFYSAVLGMEVQKHDIPGGAIGVLPHEGEEIGGCLYTSQETRPSDQGPLLYLNCAGRLEEAEAAVEPNGGRVLEAKHSVGPYGFRSVVLDSEGNRMALHSM